MAKQKKRFLDSIGAALRENVVEEVVIAQKVLPKRKLGFLDMLGGEELGGDALNEVMPLREAFSKKKTNKILPKDNPIPTVEVAPLKRQVRSVEYSAEVYTELLEKVRDIAHSRQLTINEIFNQALKGYVDKYWTIAMMSEDE